MNIKSIIKPPKSKKIKAGNVMLEPGESVGEHVTENREEIIVVLKGTATLMIDGKVSVLKQGEIIFIKENLRHDVKNNGKEIVEYIYIVCF